MSKHLARIGQIAKIQEILVTDKEGKTNPADSIQTAFVYGFEVIVSKNHKVGDVGVFFEASDTQLSDEYCKQNNLYRHSELNNNTEKAGYLEDNRKLKVQRFLKAKSEGLFMPLESLGFTGGDISNLKIGDAFEEFNGVKICQKFYNKQTSVRMGSKKKIRNVETPLFHEHVDTEQLAYYIRSIKKGSLITLHHKKHGCVKHDTKIITKEYGELTIKEIVDEKKQCSVLSYDILNDTEEYQEVLDWHFIPNDGAWYEIEMEDGTKLTLTGNNPVWLPLLGCYRKAEVLSIGDTLLIKD